MMKLRWLAAMSRRHFCWRFECLSDLVASLNATVLLLLVYAGLGGFLRLFVVFTLLGPPCRRQIICIEVDWGCVTERITGLSISCASALLGFNPIPCIVGLLIYDFILSRCCERFSAICVYWFSGIIAPCYGVSNG